MTTRRTDTRTLGKSEAGSEISAAACSDSEATAGGAARSTVRPAGDAAWKPHPAPRDRDVSCCGQVWRAAEVPDAGAEGAGHAAALGRSRFALRVWLRLLLVGVLLFPAVGATALKVVATTQTLAVIAAAVGGEHVEAKSLTPGEADPHFAEAKPSMIRAAHDAELLLAVGAELEIGWLPAVLATARNARVLPGASGHLDLSTGMALLDKPTGPVTRAMGDVHAQGNPHYWLDPENGLKIAQAIARRLAELDPKHAADYRANLAGFERALTERLARWRTELAPLRGKPVIAYHQSFVYLARAFGFRIVAEVEPKPGIPPSPSHLKALIERIRADGIRLLIMEPFYERRSTAYLAEQTGIKLALLPHSVGAQAGIKTYPELFDAIVAAIGASGGL